jgi:HK97 family phage portal protein
MGWSQLIKLVSYSADIYGMAFVAKEEAGRTLSSLRPLESGRMDPVRNSAQEIVAWNYRTHGGRIERFEREELLILVNVPDPKDAQLGMSLLDPARIEIDQLWSAANFNQTIFKNAGGPGGVYSTPDRLNADQLQQLSASIRQRYSGPEAAGRPLVLHSGIGYSSTSFSPKDLAIIDLAKLAAERICSVFSVPPPIIGHLERATYSNFQEALRYFHESVILPNARRWSEILTRGLCDVYQPEAEVQIDASTVSVLREDLTEKIAQAEALQRLGYSINSINQRLDLGMPEEEWGEETVADRREAMDALMSGGGDSEESGGDDDEDDDDTAEKAVSKSRPPIRIDLSNPEVRQAFLERIQRQLDPIRGKMAKVAARYYRDVRAALIRRLEEYLAAEEPAKAAGDPVPDPEVIERLFWELADDVVPLSTRLAPLMELAQQLGVMQTARELDWGMDDLLDRVKPALTRLMEGRQVLLAQFGIDDTLKPPLAKTLSEGFAVGDGQDALVDRIRDVFKNRDVVNPERIADTESGIMLNSSRYESAKASGAKLKVWMSSKDEHVRDSHVAADAQGPIPWDEPFVNGLMHPGEAGGAAEEVINCRCIGGVAMAEDPEPEPEPAGDSF